MMRSEFVLSSLTVRGTEVAMPQMSDNNTRGVTIGGRVRTHMPRPTRLSQLTDIEKSMILDTIRAAIAAGGEVRFLNTKEGAFFSTVVDEGIIKAVNRSSDSFFDMSWGNKKGYFSHFAEKARLGGNTGAFDAVMEGQSIDFDAGRNVVYRSWVLRAPELVVHRDDSNEATEYSVDHLCTFYDDGTFHTTYDNAIHHEFEDGLNLIEEVFKSNVLPVDMLTVVVDGLPVFSFISDQRAYVEYFMCKTGDVKRMYNTFVEEVRIHLDGGISKNENGVAEIVAEWNQAGMETDPSRWWLFANYVLSNIGFGRYRRSIITRLIDQDRQALIRFVYLMASASGGEALFQSTVRYLFCMPDDYVMDMEKQSTDCGGRFRFLRNKYIEYTQANRSLDEKRQWLLKAIGAEYTHSLRKLV